MSWEMSRAQEESQTGEKKSPKKCIMSRWLCHEGGKILEGVRGITGIAERSAQTTRHGCLVSLGVTGIKF